MSQMVASEVHLVLVSALLGFIVSCLITLPINPVTSVLADASPALHIQQHLHLVFANDARVDEDEPHETRYRPKV